MSIEWEKQICGVHQGTYEQVVSLMPDLKTLLDSFPEDVNDFIWDVKVHMLMPNQYPCIPNWHFDNVPRVNNAQDFSLVRVDLPMYLWISGEPLTEFRKGGSLGQYLAESGIASHKRMSIEELCLKSSLGEVLSGLHIKT